MDRDSGEEKLKFVMLCIAKAQPAAHFTMPGITLRNGSDTIENLDCRDSFCYKEIVP
jgi:hypothetical protein